MYHWHCLHYTATIFITATKRHPKQFGFIWGNNSVKYVGILQATESYLYPFERLMYLQVALLWLQGGLDY